MRKRYRCKEGGLKIYVERDRDRERKKVRKITREREISQMERMTMRRECVLLRDN